MVSENRNNELELIKKIALGDKSALLELYHRYEYILFNYARTFVIPIRMQKRLFKM